MNLNNLRERVSANLDAGLSQWHGLTSAEIGRLNGALMFGDNDEAFPSSDEWSRIVD